MRTTVTLDADVEAAIRRLMAQRGVSFKRALNDAIRLGTSTSASSGERRSYTRPRDLGVPAADLTHALRIAADLEDEELVTRMRRGA